jgi:hypothetical protein
MMRVFTASWASRLTLEVSLFRQGGFWSLVTGGFFSQEQFDPSDHVLLPLFVHVNRLQ